MIILGSKRLSFDIFQTIMVEVEAILNSRPLTNVADQPENEEPLTLNHFLIQRPYSSLPTGNFGDQQPASFKNWKHVQQLMNHVWRRLIKEYLPTLLKRRKWTDNNQPPLKVGDVVWVLKDLTPRGIWPLGRVVETSPGRDGEVRVASGRRPRTGFFSVVFVIQIFRSGLRQHELHPPPLMFLPLQYLHFQLYRFRISDQTTIKMIFNPCPPSWSMFPMTLETQEKHEFFADD